MRPKPRFPEGVDLKRTFETKHGIGQLSCSSDGGKLATTHNSQRVCIWSSDDGKMRTIALNHGASYGIAWSPDDAMLGIIPNPGHDLRLYDTRSGKPVERPFKGHDGQLMCVSWSSNGDVIATGSEDKFVGLWNAATGELLRGLEGHAGAVTAVAWSPDGKLLASASGDDKTVRVWNPETGEQISVYRPAGELKARVWNISWLPDGSRIATGWGDKSIRLIEVRSGRDAGLLEWSDDPRSLSISVDGSLLAVARSAVHDQPCRHFSVV